MSGQIFIGPGDYSSARATVPGPIIDARARDVHRRSAAAFSECWSWEGSSGCSRIMISNDAASVGSIGNCDHSNRFLQINRTVHVRLSRLSEFSIRSIGFDDRSVRYKGVGSIQRFATKHTICLSFPRNSRLVLLSSERWCIIGSDRDRVPMKEILPFRYPSLGGKVGRYASPIHSGIRRSKWMTR